ncbi:MAG TPA: BON domain-containing protein, partial [Vicinamibacteria bacterium]|nr:BON domain-containing protein [Vicinamibacteria bacterium]
MLHVLLLSASFLAAVPPAPEGDRNPAVIEQEVMDLVQDVTLDREDAVFNYFEVKVDAGVVTLSGTVRHASRGQQIAREVARIPGVREVRNELHAPDLGAGDERLRRELMQGIYGSNSLSRYALHRVPPIRILVERGTVVLAGRVSSAVERDLLT